MDLPGADSWEDGLAKICELLDESIDDHLQALAYFVWCVDHFSTQFQNEQAREYADGLKDAITYVDEETADHIRALFAESDKRGELLKIVKEEPLRALFYLDWIVLDMPDPNNCRQHFESFIIDGDGYFLIRSATRGFASSHMAKQAVSHLRFHPHHALFRKAISGDKHFELVSPDSLVEDDLQSLQKNTKELRIAIVAFADNTDLAWRYLRTKNSALADMHANTVKPIPVVADGMIDEETRNAAIEHHLSWAKSQGANVLVFPELTITDEGRKVISRWLRSEKKHSLVWVVAGSFHEADPTDNTKVWNSTVSFNRKGQVVFNHRKLGSFGKYPAQEGITVHGNTMGLYNSQVGVISTPICLDFCNRNPATPDAGLFVHVPVTWLWVPSMDTKPNAHVKMAQDMKLVWETNCAVAIQPPLKRNDLGCFGVIDGPSLSPTETRQTEYADCQYLYSVKLGD